MTVLFSTIEHGSRIPDLDGVTEAPRLRGAHLFALLVGAVLGGACATVVAPISLPPLYGATGLSGWHLFWVIPLALAAMWALVHLVPAVFRLFRDEFHQPSIALRAAVIVTSAAITIALLVWSWIIALAPDPWFAELAPIPRNGAALAAVVCAVALIGLPFVARRIARTTRTVLELRAHGRRLSGELVEREDPSLWIQDRPQFLVRVRFRDGADERTIRASMSTTPDQVPVVGSAVSVLVGEDGTTHVEADLRHPLVFERDAARYRAESGGGN